MTYDEAVKNIQPGRYRHYKGNEYEVLFIGRHSETTEPMVVYRAMYGEGEIWCRPANMWNEIVEVDGKHIQRFEMNLMSQVKELVNYPCLPLK